MSCSIFFSPTDSWFSRWKLTNLNNSPNSFDISLSRLSQKRSCTRQMQFFHECLPGRYAVYNHRLQSADVSCPNRAKTHRSDYQNHVCNHPKHGRNQQSHLASSDLKHCPTSTGCFLITEHFKFTQTIRINFIHSTDLVTGLEDFSAVLVNWKQNDDPIIIILFL